MVKYQNEILYFSGSYTSDVFKHGIDLLFDHPAMIFRSFLIHGTISKEILTCALFKGGFKSASKFDSYRAIAGASQLLKLFEYVIIILWGYRLCSDTLQLLFKIILPLNSKGFLTLILFISCLFTDIYFNPEGFFQVAVPWILISQNSEIRIINLAPCTS